jgi:hypothetical protein
VQTGDSIGCHVGYTIFPLAETAFHETIPAHAADNRDRRTPVDDLRERDRIRSPQPSSRGDLGLRETLLDVVLE